MRRSLLAAFATVCSAPIRIPRSRAASGGLLAELKLRDDAGYLSVPASFNGAPVSLLVDTGAEGGLVTPDIVRALGLPRDPTQSTFVQGSRGGRPVPNVLIQQFALDHLVLGTLSVPVGALPGAPSISPPVAGLLGANVLSHFAVEMDVRGGFLKFWQPGAAVGFAGMSLPLIRDGDRLKVPVTLDGTQFLALLDSGARSRVVAEHTAQRLGIDAERLAVDPGGVTSGVDLRRSIYHWHRFSTFQVGGQHERNPVLTVAPLPPDIDMLLGADWFAAHRVWIDYTGLRLTFAPR